VVPAGRRLGEREVTALAAFGLDPVPVFRRLRVAVISTGAELVAVGERPGAGQVRDVNQHALAAAVQSTGAAATRAGIAPEDTKALADRLRSLMNDHDVLIVSGGSSVGSKDFTAEAVVRLSGELLFHGIDVRPGRPTLAARIEDRTFIGLPGVPAAALTIFQVLIEPMLRRLQGETTEGRPAPVVAARLEQEVASRAGREDYVRVQLQPRGGEIWARPLPSPNSLATLARADGLIVVPESAERLDAGAVVSVRLI
jgi:molybdopterin molybdotransferase